MVLRTMLSYCQDDVIRDLTSRLQKNLEHEEENGRKEHYARYDSGKQTKLSFHGGHFIFRKEGIASAGDCGYVVSRSFLKNNNNDHGDTGNHHENHKRNTKTKEYIGFGRCCKNIR